MTQKQWPWEAIRARCLDCQIDAVAVEGCEFGPGQFNECSLWPYRIGEQVAAETGKQSEERAIRQYCLWCCCGNRKEIAACPAEEFCALYPFRPGQE